GREARRPGRSASGRERLAATVAWITRRSEDIVSTIILPQAVAAGRLKKSASPYRGPGATGPGGAGAQMASILERIVASKKQEVDQAQAALPSRDLERLLVQAPPVRDFRAALDRPGEIRFIAEIKKASPSAGVIRADFDPVAIARTYEQHGA